MSTSDAPAEDTPEDTPDDAPPAAPGTGAASIDAALGRLDGLDGSPLGDHAAVYERVHNELRSALDDPGDSDSGPDAPAGG